MKKRITIRPGQMTLADFKDIWTDSVKLVLTAEAYDWIDAGSRTVAELVGRHETVYGVNTGFGLLANERIPDEDLSRLQTNLVLSHAAGYGESLNDIVVRLILALKVNALARGHSGVGRQIVDNLLALSNSELYPCIPEKGSVGASGDLAPLAHLTSTMLGQGKMREGGVERSAGEALLLHGIPVLELGPKEGLALLNGTQVSTALALDALFRTERLLSASLVIGGMSVDAILGTDAAFDERIHAVRGHRGQIDCAQILRDLLQDSEIRNSHVDCKRVQDPYSIRSMPQVLGACLDQLRHAAGVLLTEANAVTDNPLVFSETSQILSGANFHAEPVAFAADNLALCIAEIGALSERRIALLIDPFLSELPAFLVEEGGLNSGFMIPQVTAAALASENKSLAHPASVDSLPTSANQEDHVSMATFAARRLGDMYDNTAGILAVEYLCAAQGIDFRRPLSSSVMIEQAYTELRKEVPFYDRDRPQAPDMETARRIIEAGDVSRIISADPFGIAVKTA